MPVIKYTFDSEINKRTFSITFKNGVICLHFMLPSDSKLPGYTSPTPLDYMKISENSEKYYSNWLYEGNNGRVEIYYHNIDKVLTIKVFDNDDIAYNYQSEFKFHMDEKMRNDYFDIIRFAQPRIE